MNKITNIIVGCVAVTALVFAVIVVVGGHRVGDDGPASGGGGTSGLVGENKVGNAVPDDVVVAADADGGSDETVTDRTSGYSFTMPTNWYLEPNAGVGLTIYPDYDPKSGQTPACKIEIAEIPANSDAVTKNSWLDAWITNEVHADPTIDVIENSRTTIQIGAATTQTGSAVEWQGTMNGMVTTLVYAPAPDGNGILEFAPSTLADDDADGGDDCTIELQALLANINL